MTDRTGSSALFWAFPAVILLACGCRGGVENELRPRKPVVRASPRGAGAEERLSGSLVRTYGHVGVVVREHRIVVAAPFNARLLERFIHAGQEVRAGQPLARFDSDSVNRALAVARAAVDDTVAALKVARVEAEQAVERYRRRQGRMELFAEEQLAEVRAEVEVSRARLESAEARSRAARASAEEARFHADRAVLRAPMDGVVDEVYGSVGTYGTQGSPVVALEAGEWRVRFAAPPNALVGLSPGSPIAVTPQDGDSVLGFVISASPELDARTLLLTFEAQLCTEDLPVGTPVRVLAVPRPAAGASPLACPQVVDQPPGER